MKNKEKGSKIAVRILAIVLVALLLLSVFAVIPTAFLN